MYSVRAARHAGVAVHKCVHSAADLINIQLGFAQPAAAKGWFQSNVSNSKYLELVVEAKKGAATAFVYPRACKHVFFG